MTWNAPRQESPQYQFGYATSTIQISVVIPVHNRSALLRRALKSVAAQTRAPNEVIIVDDGSIEDIGQVVGEIGLETARVIRLPVQSGPGAARNAGITAATGTYIALLDSDDEWTDNKLAVQMEHLLGPNKHALSCTAFHSHNGDGSATLRTFQKDSFSTPDMAFGCGLSPGSTLIARRNLFEEVGLFDTRLPRLEDWDWLIGVGKSHPIGVVTQPLARIHRSSPPSARAVVESCRQIKSRHLQTFRECGLGFRLRFSAALHHEIAVARFNDRQYLGSALSFCLSMITYPLRELSFYRRIFSRLAREIF